ncbi:fungal specific transcription factor domain-containing protein [Stagonosporopsis vannaccii]|nr:fungal specific transcription factor domain-containing protein [Stagonosporopsis vannaccii]
MSLSSGPSAARVYENAANHSAPMPKRRRLNLACNYCRSRKTRCDEQKPSCHACLAAGLECITTDPRRPNQPVERREAGKGLVNSAVSTGSFQSPEHLILQHQTASNVSPEVVPSTILDGASGEELPTSLEEQPPPLINGYNNTNNNAGGPGFHGLLPILKHEVSSTSVDVLTGWLNVASFRLGLGHRFGLKIPHNTDQYHHAFPIPAPSILDLPDLLACSSNYFESVGPVYPVIDQEEMYTTLEKVQTHGISTLVPDPEHLPQIVIALVVIDIGSSVASTASSDTSDLYAFLKDLLGRLIGRPTIPNIKALFLLALDMYYHDDLASSWSTITLCISMAKAVGLDKSRTVPAADSNYNKENGMWTWWSIFILESLIAFETGQRSSISLMEFAEPLPTFLPENVRANDGPRSAEDTKFFNSVFSFAKLLGKIGKRCIDIRDREEVSGKDEIQRLVAEKVKVTGESCVELTYWAETLPDHLRPGSDLIYDRRTFPYAAFISLHYFNAFLVLARNSLLISEMALRDTTEIISKDQPWGHIIRNGQPMVASTARKLIKLLVEAEESEATFLVPHTNAALHALYVLAVHLMRHPETMLRKTDLDLIRHAAHFAKRRVHPGTAPQYSLDSILGEIDNVLKQSNMSDLGSRRRVQGTPLGKSQVHLPNDDASDQTLLSGESDITLYTLPNTSGFSHEHLLGQLPELGDYNNDELYYYGMDIGAWIGLESMTWDSD